MLNRCVRASTLGAVLFAALASSPAHAMPTPTLPLAVVAAPSIEVKIDNHLIGTFTELVSISSSQDPAAKSSKKFSVVLRRQVTTNIEFAAWTEVGMNEPAAAKKAVVITVLAGGDPKMRFALTKAYPTKIEYTSVPKSDVMMETVTMTAEFIQRTSV